MNHNLSARRSVRGFTLVELLVVTLILSILMAVALPLYLSSVADARTKTCQANMQTIANAVQAARVKSADKDYTNVVAGGVTTANLPDLQTVPQCPNKGNYTLATVPGVNGSPDSFSVTCDKGDGTFTPGLGVRGANTSGGGSGSNGASGP